VCRVDTLLTCGCLNLRGGGIHIFMEYSFANVPQLIKWTLGSHFKHVRADELVGWQSFRLIVVWT
jgi:hypothetical protein